MRKLIQTALAAGLLVIAACGGDSATTTSSTSTSAPTTTTTEASTTTDTSTTTTADTSTTTTGAAVEPAVVGSRYGLMGWWDGGAWVIPETLEEIPLTGGEEFQVVMLDEPITTASGSVPTLCEPSQTPVIEFDPTLPGEFKEPGGIAIISDWDLRPSPVQVDASLSDDDYQAMVDVLTSLDIETDPVIFQSIAADIDSDGTDEIVIVSKFVAENLFGRPGDYSVVLLRKLIEGEWQTAILESSVAVADQAYILSHSIGAIADLNGDGKMEIVVDAAYYEGSGTVAYEYIDDDLGPQPVLMGGCGA